MFDFLFPRDWSTLKKLIWLKGAALSQLREFAGAIVSFVAAKAKLIKSIICNINPVQDLHGYANPWPAGGGKNKGNFVDGKGVDSSGNVVDQSGRCATVEPIPIDANNSYVVSATDANFIYAVWNGSTLVRRKASTAPGTVLDTSGGTELYVAAYNSDPVTVAGCKPMVEIGTTPTTPYAPYSNICPISGHAGVNVYRTGTNLWDEEWEVGGYNTTTGAKSVQSNRIRSKNMTPVVPSTNYCFVKGTTHGEYILFYDADGTYLSDYSYSATKTHVFTTPANCRYVAWYLATGYGTTYNNDISINYPSTDTDYHAYSGNVYPITFTDTVIPDIEASQNLHGYDKPWPGGVGKNLCPSTLSAIKSVNTDGTWSGNVYSLHDVTFEVLTDSGDNVLGVKVNGTASEYGTYLLCNADMAGLFANGTKLLVSGGVDGGGATSYRLDWRAKTGGVSFTALDVYDSSPKPHTVGSTIAGATESYLRVIAPRGQSVSNLVFRPMIQLASISDTTFNPYTNTCPITPITLTRDDSTTLDIYGGTVTGVLDGSGSLTGGLLTVTRSVASLPAQSWSKYTDSQSGKYGFYFTLSDARIADVGDDDCVCSSYNAVPTIARSTFVRTQGVDGQVCHVGDSKAFYFINNNYTDKDAFAATLTGQAIVYDLGTPITYNLSLTELEGLLTTLGVSLETVYGGTLDVITGDLTVTHGSIKVSEISNIGYDVSNRRFICKIAGLKKAPWQTLALLSSELRTQIGGSFDINWDNCIYNNADLDTVSIHAHAYTDSDTMRTALANVQIVYPLDTPITYHVNPTQISTLVGQNNIWHDGNGNVTVVAEGKPIS